MHYSIESVNLIQQAIRVIFQKLRSQLQGVIGNQTLKLNIKNDLIHS